MVETYSSREEMTCPSCLNKSLEEDKKKAKKYDQESAKIIKATRCANPKCDFHNGVPPREMESIYEPTFSQKLPKDFLQRVAPGAVLIVLLIGVVWFVGIPGIGGDSAGVIEQPAQLQYTIDGEVEEGLLVEINAETYETDQNGEIEISDIEAGTYEMTVQLQDLAQYTTLISISQQGEVEYIEEESELIEDGIFNYQTSSEFTSVRASSREDAEATFLDISDSYSIEFIPPEIEGESFQYQIPESLETFELPEGSQDSTTISTTVSPEQSQQQQTILPTDSTITIEGDTPTTVEFNVDTEESLPVQTEEKQLGLEEQFIVNLENPTATPPELTLRGGSDEELVEQLQYPDVSTISLDHTGQSRIELRGEERQERQTSTGLLTQDDSDIGVSVGGNLPATDVQLAIEEIEFTENIIDSDIIENDQSNDEVIDQVIELPGTGEYNIQTETIIEERDFSAFLLYDQTRQELDAGNQQQTIEVEEDESITLRTEASASELSTRIDNSVDIEISDLETTVTGQDVAVEFTATNTGNSQITQIPVFYGDELGENIGGRGSLSPGESASTSARFTIEDSGVYAISIGNQEEVDIISVLGAERTSGKGIVNYTVSQTEDQGFVSIEDCTLQDGDTCSLTELSSGVNSIETELFAVEEAEYSLSYTEREAPQDVTVLADGTEQTTIDTLTREQFTQFEVEDKTEIEITSATETEFEYDIYTLEPKPISNPTVFVEEEEVYQSELIELEETIELPNFEEGVTSVTVTADSSGHTGELTIIPQATEELPSISIDGQQVCTRSDLADGQCTTTIEPGSYNISSQNLRSSFNMSYQQNNIQTEIPVTIGDRTVEITPDSEITKEGWTGTEQIETLEEDTNVFIADNIVGTQQTTLSQEYTPGVPEDVTVTLENTQLDQTIEEVHEGELRSPQMTNLLIPVSGTYTVSVEADEEVEVEITDN